MEQIDIAQKQLEQFYLSMSQTTQRIVEIRKWAVTVWLAIIIAVGSDKISIGTYEALFSLFMSISCFWLLEGLHFATIRVDHRKARRLEKFIASYNSDQNLPVDYFYVSSYGVIAVRDKFWLMMRALFKSPMLTAFYIILSALSIAYVLLFIGGEGVKFQNNLVISDISLQAVSQQTAHTRRPMNRSVIRLRNGGFCRERPIALQHDCVPGNPHFVG